MVNVLENLSDLIKQEKWARTSISEITTNTFLKYDDLIDRIIKEDKLDEAMDICENSLKVFPNSIISLYISQILYLKTGFNDFSNCEKLISIFKENKKNNIAKFLCEKFLEYGSSKNLLTEYINILELEKESEDKIIPYLEKLAKLDYSEIKTTRRLAKYFEDKQIIEKSIYYYRKILEYFIKNKNISEIETYWNKIVELSSQKNNDFLFDYLEKIGSMTITNNNNIINIGSGLALKLGEGLILKAEEGKNWDIIIKTIKTIYKYIPQKFKDIKATELRQKIINAYRNIYTNNSNFEDCLKKSQLNQTWKNLYDAIEIFEKYISFDKSNFVFHSKLGVGYIKDIKNNFLVIDFDIKKDHQMDIDMAIKSLVILPSDDLSVMKKVKENELNELIKNNPGEVIKRTLKSIGGKGTSQDIKKYLIKNNIIEEKNWNSLWERAKEILKNDPLFTKSFDKNNEYFLRDKPVSFEDSILEEFKSTSDIFDKAKVLKKFIDSGGDLNSENFSFMIGYLNKLISADLEVSQNFVIAYLILKDLKKMYPDLNINFPFSIEELFEQLKANNKFYFSISDPYLEKIYLDNIYRYVSDWKNIFINYLKKYGSKYALNFLIFKEEKSAINEIIKDVLKNYRENPDLFIWYCKNLFFKDLSVGFDINKEEIILLLVNLLDNINKALIQKINTVANRKIYNSIIEILFKDGELEKIYTEKKNIDTLKKIPKLFFRIKDMKAEHIVEFKIILSKYFTEYIKELGLEEEKEEKENIFFVTRESIIEKQRYLQNLIQVEIPRTNNEMMQAKEKGDLRENAEYIAARERLQELNEEAATIQEDLNKAREIDFNNIDTSKISIGTKVTLLNLDENKEIVYTILGKWDVDLSKNIISYETALGQSLLNKKINETFINEQDRKKYKVVKIDKYK
ncbi:MAG: GreA/GreB family elongation factor [Spirochaetes bacterium]|nr:GreA/GreB family elongation factor [Spirochaetota bacterium]